MKAAGWIFLIVSWGAILALCLFCFREIFHLKAEEHLVAPLEIETELPEEERKDEKPPSE